MTQLGCDAVRRRLQAFHDGELSRDDDVAIALHLDACAPCAAEVRRLRTIGQALRRAAAWRQLTGEELHTVHETLVGRLTAERNCSWAVRLARMFEDMHLVWAGLGASVAALLCVAVTVAMLHRVTDERSDSLKAILSALASPGSNENPVRLDGRMSFPRVYPDDVMPAVLVRTDVQDEDVIFTLSGVVTREGRMADLEMLPRAQRLNTVALLHAASSVRVEPARFDRTLPPFENGPVAVNVVWLLARTTVRPRGT